MHLSPIRKRLQLYGLLFALAVLGTLWFKPTRIASALLWGSLLVFFAVLFIWQGRRLQSAKLIWDTRILVVPAASFDQGDGMPQVVDETIVSTFGVLSAGQIYEWGRRGLRGIRLMSLEIDPRKMCLSFGIKDRIMRLEFRHGLDSMERVREVTEKIWRETGVQATIRDLCRE